MHRSLVVPLCSSGGKVEQREPRRHAWDASGRGKEAETSDGARDRADRHEVRCRRRDKKPHRHEQASRPRLAADWPARAAAIEPGIARS